MTTMASSETESDTDTETDEQESVDTSELESYSPQLQHSDRELVESLIACDEEQGFQILVDVLPVETPEAVTAWQRTRPNVKYVWNKKQRRTEPTEIQDDIGISYYGNHTGYIGCHSNEVVTHNYSGNRAQGSNRGEDVWPGRVPPDREYQFIPAWKMGVEPRTYRYVPNNGRYRASKGESRSAVQLHRPVRKMWEKLTWQQKQLQKEIQRELRQEYEKFTEYEKMKKEGAANTAKGDALHVTEDPEEESPREQKAPDTSRSTKSGDEAIPIPAKGGRRQRRRSSVSSVELPPIGIPLVSKSYNDDYLSSFRSRISALDKEIKQDQRIFHKSYDDITKSVESDRLMMSQLNKLRAEQQDRQPNFAGQLPGAKKECSATLEKTSSKTDIGKNMKTLERVRRAASESQAIRRGSEHVIRHPFRGCNTGDVDSAAEMQLSVSSLNPNPAEDSEEQPAPEPVNKSQATLMHKMPLKKETLTEETFQVRKITSTVTPETRVPFKYSHTSSTADFGGMNISGSSALTRGRDSAHSEIDQVVKVNNNAISEVCASAVDCEVPASSRLSPAVDYSPSSPNSAPSSGGLIRITKVGGSPSSASTIASSEDPERRVREAPTRRKQRLGLLPKATEIASTKEALAQLISASKLYSSAAGRYTGRNGFPSNGGGNAGRIAPRSEGRCYGDAFHSSPVGRVKPKRVHFKKAGRPLPDAFLPEISGKRLGQAVSSHRFASS